MADPRIEEARAAALEALAAVETADALDAWRRAELGKGGRVPRLMRLIPELAGDERPAFGAAVNGAKQALEAAHAARATEIKRAAVLAEIEGQAIDVTLPGTPPPRGGLHPSTRIHRRIASIFGDMGFQVYKSRAVETDDLNFGLLNTPKHHPARDMQDTFYVDEEVVLRTHTSPGQIHAMREHAPEPIRIILPGMVWRNEKLTARSEFQFTQVEGLAVGPGITMADLKGTIENFVRRFYGPGRAVRFRASYFPFTEPSAEVDVSCALCEGAGCRLCKGRGWLEIMGSGMVHPVVLENGGYDPRRMSGFAFGMGPERITMLRHGIDDIRHFWANDLRFLEQLR